MEAYATCGRGTEVFAKKELHSKLKCHVKSVEDGKVFFTMRNCDSTIGFKDLYSIFDLKTVERIFAAVAHFPTDDIKGNGKVYFLKALKDRILNHSSLRQVVKDLLNIQSQHKQDSVPCVGVPSGDDKCTDDYGPPVKKPRIQSDFLPNLQAQGCVESNRIVTELPKFKETDVCGGDPIVSFRFSVKCSGWCRKWLQPQRLAKELGIRLTIMTGWAVNLQQPDLEICVHVNDEFVTVGIPFASAPLSKRSYILDPGLRSTVSWIMASLADIQTGNSVLDPMCGKATILVEAAQEHAHGNIFFGCDLDNQQLQAAARNVEFGHLQGRVCLLQADALNVPLESATVDRIVCDAPFGQKFKTAPLSLPEFYTKLLCEMHRLLVPGGRAVLLTSQDLLPVVESNSQRVQHEADISDTLAGCSKSTAEVGTVDHSSTSRSNLHQNFLSAVKSNSQRVEHEVDSSDTHAFCSKSTAEVSTADHSSTSHSNLHQNLLPVVEENAHDVNLSSCSSNHKTAADVARTVKTTAHNKPSHNDLHQNVVHVAETNVHKTEGGVVNVSSCTVGNRTAAGLALTGNATDHDGTSHISDHHLTGTDSTSVVTESCSEETSNLTKLKESVPLDNALHPNSHAADSSTCHVSSYASPHHITGCADDSIIPKSLNSGLPSYTSDKLTSVASGGDTVLQNQGSEKSQVNLPSSFVSNAKDLTDCEEVLGDGIDIKANCAGQQLSLLSSHYVKLGETHAYIVVLQKPGAVFSSRR